MSNKTDTVQSITNEFAPNVKQAVANLPEIYQPVYGHPEFSQDAARTCDDRLVHILEINDRLSQQLGRPLRILDMGCAQGYISLSLAARGAAVVGIDVVPENIALCKVLAAQHPEYVVGFKVAMIESFLLQPDLEHYDLVIGLSVFHHLNHKHDHQQVTQLLTQAGKRVAAWIFEFALQTEPLYWAAAQPVDHNTMASGFAFVRELARIPTHLSNIDRPLVFGSNSFWFVDDSFEHFTSWSSESHKYVGGLFQDSRRYYYNEQKMLKFFSTQGIYGAINTAEINSESAFLSNGTKLLEPCPALHSTGKSATNAWLLREMLDGEMLATSIEARKTIDYDRVVHDVLVQLVQLENHGLYHTDLRTWNVLTLRSGGATVIDYGAIGPIAEDCVWPNNLILGFWVFVGTVCGTSKNPGVPRVAPFVSPFHLPERYRAWGFAIWNTPPETWSFRLLLDELDRIGLTESKRASTTQELWMTEIEGYLNLVNEYQRSLTDAIQTTHKTQLQHSQLINHLMKTSNKTDSHL